MDISLLQDANGFIKIAAIDHRSSLKKILAEDKLEDFKGLCTENFAPFVTAILVDPEYGDKARESARQNNVSIILSREQSGYLQNPDGRVTELYSQFNSHKLKKMGASAIKLHLYYNADAANAADQRQVAEKVKMECVAADIPLLLEPVTYTVPDSPYHKGDAIMHAINDLRAFADILKLEFPIDVDDETEDMDAAIPYLSAMTIESKVPWILLSLGMQFDSYKKALGLSKDAGCNGFAVGRAVWQEIDRLSTWPSVEDFIKTTATDRMRQLAELF